MPHWLVVFNPSSRKGAGISRRARALLEASKPSGLPELVWVPLGDLARVAKLPDRILLIDRGQLVLDTTLESISTDFRRIRGVYDTAPKPATLALDGVQRVTVDGRTVSVIVTRNSISIAERMRAQSASAVEVLPMTLKEIVLESLRRDEVSGKREA